MRTFLVIVLLGLIISANARAVETLRPEQLKPGMKGYGLTVFKGTEPEKFDVEIIGVLKNAMPRQDMILIRCKHPVLEHANIIQGMSGSPVCRSRWIGRSTTPAD